MTTPRRALVTLTAVVAVALAACGDDGPDDPTPPTSMNAPDPLAADCATLDAFFAAANSNTALTEEGPLTTARRRALAQYVDELVAVELTTEEAITARGEFAGLLADALDDADDTDDLVAATLDHGARFRAFNEHCNALV